MKVKPTIITGLCTCGHVWDEHHISYIMNVEYMAELKKIAPEHPPCFPEECLFYGSNEEGGLIFNEETEEWEDHCHRYTDTGAQSE